MLQMMKKSRSERGSHYDETATEMVKSQDKLTTMKKTLKEGIKKKRKNTS